MSDGANKKLTITVRVGVAGLMGAPTRRGFVAPTRDGEARVEIFSDYVAERIEAKYPDAKVILDVDQFSNDEASVGISTGDMTVQSVVTSILDHSFIDAINAECGDIS